MSEKYLDIWTAKKINGAGESPAPGDDNRSVQKELTREQMDVYTFGKLREAVEYAVENSLFYSEKYGDYIKEDILNSDVSAARNEIMQWFETLPFTTPDELREKELEFLCVKPGQISRIVTLDTGGSTGVPKRVHFTQEDQYLTVDFFENGMQLLINGTDRLLILMPAKMPGSIGKLLAQAVRNFGAEAVEYGLPAMSPAFDERVNREETEKLLKLIEEQQITSVVALPTHMEMLAEAAVCNEGCVPECIKSVLLSAEYVSDEVCRKIEDVFGCRVYEHYGMTEMGLGCAVSCGQGEGYHIRETDLYIEIIDPKTGKVIEDESVGEVVFTTLTRKGMPFIRYRTGDFSRWINEPCACGSVLKRLAKVGSRDVVKGYLEQAGSGVAER